MTRLRWWSVAACVALLAVTSVARPAPAPADKAGLDQVPASAPIVVHVRGVQGVRDRFVAMMENALPEVLKKIQPPLDDFLKNGKNGRKLRGLAKNGPIYIVFTEMPRPNGNPPKVAVIAAVTNFTEFRDNLMTEEERKEIKDNGEGVQKAVIENEPTFFVDRKGYAVISPNEDVAAAFTKKQPGLDGRLSKELAARLLASDVGLYVSMDAVNKDYAEQIKQARKAIDDVIQASAGQADASQKHFIEIARKLVGPIFQAVEDSQGLLVTAEFRPNGLALHAQTEVRAGSPSADFLSKARPSAFKDLARMPSGRIYYSGLQTSPELYKTVGGLMQGVVSDPDSKDAKAIAEALERLARAGPGEQIDAFAFPPSGLRVYHFAEPAKAVAAQLELLKALDSGGTFQSGTLKEKPVIKKAAQKYGDFELNSVSLVWDLDKMADKAAAGKGAQFKQQALAGLKWMMGEKLNLWFGTDGKVVVQVAAADWPAAQKLLDQYFKDERTVGTVKPFREVRKEMPAEATFLTLADVVQLLAPVAANAKPLLGNLFPLPPNFPVMPAKDVVSFVGFAVTLQPGRGRVDSFISASAAHEFYKAFIQPLRGD